MAVVVAAVALGVGGGRTPAHAAGPSLKGWWTTVLPVADVGVGGVGNLRDPQAVDVPEGGLLVQGGPTVDKPTAYAALAFDLGSSAVSGPLRLVPAPTTVTVPGSKLIACPLNDPSFAPVGGGSIADAPAYTCSSAVTATVDSSGAYVFDVAGLQRGDNLAVAILPSAPADRVVFAPPADDALPVGASAGAADAADAGALPNVSADAGVDSSAAGASPALSTDGGSLPGLSAGSSPPSVAGAAPSSGGGTAPASALPAAQPATATHSSSTSYVPYLIAALLGLAAVLWLGAGSAQPAENA
ncbi:MAG: hypothetical protein JO148_07685 [Acidimicrobiia bacterium]|nr:hypothetical protein [Acidimicrobiia bacterium]